MASEMTGMQDVIAALQAAGDNLSTPINAASRKALRPMVREAKANVRENDTVITRELVRSLKVKRDPSAPKSRPTHLVGPDSNSPAVRYAHLVELGTAPHMVDGKAHPGADPHPFIRPAFESTKDDVIKILGDEIGPAIEKQAAKKARRR